MRNSDIVSDAVASLGLLTRLPVRVDTARATARGAASAWAYPLVGLVVGAVGGAVAVWALWLGLPAGIAAGLMLAVMAVLTGGLHEDGLADCADGFWGGWDREHRLKIMKDSNIGTYGVLALVFGVMLRWSAASLLLGQGLVWAPVLLAAVLSRAGMVAVMHALPHARDSGLSHQVGRPGLRPTLAAGLIAAALGALIWPGAMLPALLACALAVCAVALIARAKISGQTGDVLGAAQQTGELAIWLALVALAG